MPTTTLPHLPLLRAGRPYASADRATLTDAASGAPVATVSRANPGLVGRDLAADAATAGTGGTGAGRRALTRLDAGERLAICRRAAELFTSAELPIGDGDGDGDGAGGQTPEAFVALQSATTGLPRTLCRANMAKVETVLAAMETVVAGLTRGLDPAALDRGWTVDVGGRPVSYRCEADRLGAVLPSNSPGVHSLWLPALALGVPVALKPGSREPWTPWRVAQALFAAGLPRQAIGFYPGDHAVAAEVLLGCERSLLFGDRGTVGAWGSDPRVQLHGPGWSKLVLGPDAVARWRRGGEAGRQTVVDLATESVAANGGRSCVNASGIWVAAEEGGETVADELAAALARRLGAIEALPLDHPEAALAAFPDPVAARSISGWIDRRLEIAGADDVTARHRSGTAGGGRVATAGGCTFLLPTVVRVAEPGHPLAAAELLFPFATVVAVPRRELVARMGPSLVVSALTEDRELIAELLAARHVDRINLGPVPTTRVVWDQPHEGNLFTHLFTRRAFQAEGAAAAAVPPAGAPAGSGR